MLRHKATKGSGQPILYLDFDGVLHHEACFWSARRGPFLEVPKEHQADGHVLFEHVGLLEEMLAPYGDVRIVLSTSWARSYGCTGAAKRLSPALRERVIGATWHSGMKPVENAWIQRPRGLQVCGDVARRFPSAWIALDDDDSGWPIDVVNNNYIRTDPVLGISHPRVRARMQLAFSVHFSKEAPS